MNSNNWLFDFFFKYCSQAFNVPADDLFVLAVKTFFSYSHTPAWSSYTWAVLQDK